MLLLGEVTWVVMTEHIICPVWAPWTCQVLWSTFTQDYLLFIVWILKRLESLIKLGGLKIANSFVASNALLIFFIFRCTIEKVRDDGVYLLDNGMHMLLFVGLAANPAFIQVDFYNIDFSSRVEDGIFYVDVVELITVPSKMNCRVLLCKTRQFILLVTVYTVALNGLLKK